MRVTGDRQIFRDDRSGDQSSVHTLKEDMFWENDGCGSLMAVPDHILSFSL